jgi:hypothetical protein
MARDALVLAPSNAVLKRASDSANCVRVGVGLGKYVFPVMQMRMYAVRRSTTVSVDLEKLILSFCFFIKIVFF